MREICGLCVGLGTRPIGPNLYPKDVDAVKRDSVYHEHGQVQGTACSVIALGQAAGSDMTSRERVTKAGDSQE